MGSSNNKISVGEPGSDWNSTSLFGCTETETMTVYSFEGDIKCPVIRLPRSRLPKLLPHFETSATQLGEEHTLHGDEVPGSGGPVNLQKGRRAQHRE